LNLFIEIIGGLGIVEAPQVELWGMMVNAPPLADFWRVPPKGAQ
jgi:hypothetical protein